jgi:hypothetical protein
MREDNWEDDGACTNRNPEWWFPANEANMTRNNWKALNICRGCEVRLVCLRLALDQKLEHGIYGGMLPSQRKQMTRKAKVAKRNGAWTVQQMEQHATAGSWAAAMSFANDITKGTA